MGLQTKPSHPAGGPLWHSIGRDTRSVNSAAVDVGNAHARAVRGWGRVTALAAAHQISRTRLYELRDCGQAALLAALAPQPPGPRPSVTTVTVDQPYIERAIAVLATQRGSVRGVQLGLELLFQRRARSATLAKP